MEKEEWAVIAYRLKTVYTDPDFLKDEKAVETWFNLLKDQDAQSVMIAATRYMQTQRFAPFPADLRLEKEQVSPEEAWQTVSDCLWAITSYEKAEEEFDELPSAIKRALGTADALYGYTRGEWNEAVQKSLFIKSYREVLEKETSDSKMSPKVREAVKAMTAPERKMIERAEPEKIEQKVSYDLTEEQLAEIDAKIESLRYKDGDTR